MSRFSPGLVSARRPARQFLGAHSDAANAKVYTFAACNIGDPAADREVFVLFRWPGGNNLSSVTIGGVAATVDYYSVSTNNVGSAHALIPGGTSADVVVTFTGATNAANCSIAVYRVTGRAAPGVGSIQRFDTSGTGTSLTLGTVKDYLARDGFVLAAASWASTVSNVGFAGLSAGLDAYVLPEADGHAAYGSTPVADGAGAESLVCSWTTSRAGVFSAWLFN